MHEAAEQLDRHWRHDPATEQVLAYLHKHIPEETGHDDWIIEDLARIGIPASAIVDHPPSSTVMQLVGSQYYLIKHVHPAALLGYISALEGYPPSIELSKLAAARTGYPIETFRTLRKHAHLDPHHRDDLDAVLDATPFSQPLAAAIRANALEAVAGLIRIVDEILQGDRRTVLMTEQPQPAETAAR
ncbi:MAG: iron-containing redox enzyme family protein, partial [Jatrophihabitantaceae bacterium]